MRTGSYRSSYNPIASSRRAARAASSCCCGCSPGTTTATTSSRRSSGSIWRIMQGRCRTGDDTAGRQRRPHLSYVTAALCPDLADDLHVRRVTHGFELALS